MRILLSGFEPFGGRDVNSSWDCISDLPVNFDNHIIEKVCLPVVHRQAGQVLDDAVAEFNPDAILSFGESRNDFFELERVALNLAGFPGRTDIGKWRIGSYGSKNTLSFVTLLNVSSSLILDCNFGAFDPEEDKTARPLLQHLGSGDLLLADRGFSGNPTLSRVRTQSADFLFSLFF